MGTKFIEVPVAILLHFVRRVDGQGPVRVQGDYHTANVRLRGEKEQKKTVSVIANCIYLFNISTSTKFPFCFVHLDCKQIKEAGILLPSAFPSWVFLV